MPTLRIPESKPHINQWLVLGLDPSLSRTGYAIQLVRRSPQGTSARWLAVGSLKPDDASTPVWIRSKLIALALRDLLLKALVQVSQDNGGSSSYPAAQTGLIISLEAPTPGNDFLTSISRILHLILLDTRGVASDDFAHTYVQLTNAATLRRLMGLTKTGNKNKVENVEKAYSYLDVTSYPNLDTDACDAVLMAMMGRYSAAILMGHSENVPERFLIALCNATEEVVGKGRNAKTRVKGILHRLEYWSLYERQDYCIKLCDARVKKARLEQIHFSI